MSLDERAVTRAVVLAIVGDPVARDLLSKTVPAEELHITGDLAEALTLAQAAVPDVAFIEVGLGEGAGLALVHHLKALLPGVTIFALVNKEKVELGAHAVALGGTGLLMLPLGGDEVLSAIEAVTLRLAEKKLRRDLEAAAAFHARAAGWMTRVAELPDASTKSAAARALLEVLVEATTASGGAVYLSTDEKATELVRASVTERLEDSPAFGDETAILEFARTQRLLVVPLAHRSAKAGHVLLEGAETPEPSDMATSRSSPNRVSDGLLRLLATQATTAFVLRAERDHASGAAMKDPGSSAYSFAYYVDVAGREIDKARRYGRRFAIVTVAVEPDAEIVVSATAIADELLKAARDTDILARVDEHEFHLLLPESDGLAAHATRRRILTRLQGERGLSLAPKGVLVGIASFPHDGGDLAQLLRVARRRADSSKASVVHRLPAGAGSPADLLELLARERAPMKGGDLAAPRAISIDVAEAAALAAAVVGDALRGGATFVAVAQRRAIGLGAAVRAIIGTPRENVTFHALELRGEEHEDVEALSVLAEHGAYALVARNENGVVRGVHAADPLLADVLAERLGRAAGLRVFAG